MRSQEHLLQNRVVSFSWQDSSLLVLLSKGVIVNVTYNLKTLDIVAVYFDKYLTTKIQNETISDGKYTYVFKANAGEVRIFKRRCLTFLALKVLFRDKE